MGREKQKRIKKIILSENLSWKLFVCYKFFVLCTVF
jgi:hypothetical protein